MNKNNTSKINSIPRNGKARCKKCNKAKYRLNPLARCYECKQKYCYDHIYGGQINDLMKDTDEVRNICEKCRELKNYQTLK